MTIFLVEIIIVLLLAFPLILSLLFHILNPKNGNHFHPPGPSGLPFIGNLHQFDTNYPHIYLWRLSRKYGPIMSMKLGYRKVIVISSAQVVKQVMTSHDVIFSGRPKLIGPCRLSFNGIDVAYSPYNNMWREARKIYTLHLFTKKQIQHSQTIREDEFSRMINKISLNSSLSKANNLSEMMVSMTNNLVCRVAFGKDFGDEGYERRRFYKLLKETQAMLVGFFVSDYLPRLGWIDKISGMIGRLEKNFNELDSFAQELIDEHLNSSQSVKGDLLDVLLELWRDKSYPVDVSLDHIKALLLDILIAGTDTSAAAVVWGMALLMKKPTVMEKVQAEIRESAGNKDLVEEKDIVKLPYLNAVIKETFRFCPPAPLLIPRETLEDCTLGGYEIPSKTLVFINGWGIARDPAIWENPDEFLPERFMEKEIDLKGQSPELIPFGIRRRACPGISMGMVTVEFVLANFLYKFNWELPRGMKTQDIDLDVLPGLTMHKKNALCLMAQPVLS